MLSQEHGVAAQPPLLEPVADLWFENSKMVILRAGTKEFRVPQCILTSQSRVFREVLKRDNTPTFSSANVHHYRISDPPDYAEYFLRALFHSGYFEPPPRRCGLEHALGILSLSVKYEVVYLKRRALSHLATAYPLTLDEWRHRLDFSTFQPITEYCIPYARTNIPKSLSVLKTLNQVGATWLLPAAFYECCRYDLKDLITDPAWMDGFDDGLKNTVLIGYNKQVQEARQILRFLHGPPDGDCDQPSVCLEVRRQHADESFSSWDMNDPFSIWDAGDWDLLEDMCGPCLEASKSIHAEGCAELWNRLPSLYGLPAWDVLLELKDSAML